MLIFLEIPDTGHMLETSWDYSLPPCNKLKPVIDNLVIIFLYTF